MASHDLNDVALILRAGADVARSLRAGDDGATARVPLYRGDTLRQGEREVTLRRDVPPGHKVALRDLEEGASIRKYGQIIGFATEAVAAGEHVHTHNCGVR